MIKASRNDEPWRHDRWWIRRRAVDAGVSRLTDVWLDRTVVEALPSSSSAELRRLACGESLMTPAKTMS